MFTLLVGRKNQKPMSKAEEYLKKFKETTFLPTVNTDGDLMASEKDIIDLMESYHQSRMSAITDDMLSIVQNNTPFAVKNSKGRLINPIKSQKCYDAVTESIANGLKQKLTNKE